MTCRTRSIYPCPNNVIDQRYDLWSFDFKSINNQPVSESGLKTSSLATSVSKVRVRRQPFSGGNPNISSNNGVVSIYSPEKNIVLVNPSTNRYQQLPPFPIEKFHSSAYGFGFDKLSRDFKFVLHARLRKSLKLVVFVHDLNSNLWRSMDSALDNHSLFFKIDKGFSCGVFVNSSLHWIARIVNEVNMDNRIWGPNVEVITSFDLGTEEYRLLSLPECAKTWGEYTLDVIKGCLCLSFSYDGEKGTNVDVLVMKKYGVVVSWTKLYVIELPRIEFRPRELPSLVWPRVVLDFGDHSRVLLEVYSRGLLWYDLGNKSVEYIKIWDEDTLLKSNGYLNAVVNSESLVHLSHPEPIGRPTRRSTRKRKAMTS